MVDKIFNLLGFVLFFSLPIYILHPVQGVQISTSFWLIQYFDQHNEPGIQPDPHIAQGLLYIGLHLEMDSYVILGHSVLRSVQKWYKISYESFYSI